MWERWIQAGALSTLMLTGCGDDTGGDGNAGGTAGTGNAAGTAGTGNAGGTAGTGGGGGSAGVDLPAETTRCGSKLFETPVNPAARGPWPVGARTLDIGGVATEVWYPAEYASDAGVAQVTYDIRLWLPEADQAKIPDADNTPQLCDCYRDLPLDTQRGPYPVVIFMHGTAAFRTQSLSQMTHWASRGFVVLSQDHKGLYLGDLLQLKFGADLPGDTNALLAALDSGAAPLSFLTDHIDMTRVGMAGHSAGGGGIAEFGDTPGVKVLIPMAAGGVSAGAALESTLVMGALDDGVVAFSKQQDGYATTPPTKRLIGLANAGHLAFSDLCGLSNSKGQDLVEVAQAHGVTNAGLATALWDGCADGQLPQAEATEIVNYATSAALEETLLCSETAADELSQATSRYSQISVYDEQLK